MPYPFPIGGERWRETLYNWWDSRTRLKLSLLSVFTSLQFHPYCILYSYMYLFTTDVWFYFSGLISLSRVFCGYRVFTTVLGALGTTFSPSRCPDLTPAYAQSVRDAHSDSSSSRHCVDRVQCTCSTCSKSCNVTPCLLLSSFLLISHYQRLSTYVLSHLSLNMYMFV